MMRGGEVGLTTTRKDSATNTPTQRPLKSNQVLDDWREISEEDDVRRGSGWSEITEIISPSGYYNGSDADVLIKKKLSPASPLYNRNLGPYVSSSVQNNIHQASSMSQDGLESLTIAAQRLAAEKVEVDEMLALCSEYDRQSQLERSSAARSSHGRIKTNGSLPRDPTRRRGHAASPLASPALGSPGIAGYFTFDAIPGDLNGLGDRRRSLEKCSHPYENADIISGSPRPRIKTIPTMDHSRDYSYERNENRIPLCFDVDHSKEDSSPYHTLCHTPSHHHSVKQDCGNVTGSALSSTSSQYEISLDLASLEKRSIHAENIANSKYSFLGFDPRKESHADNDPDYDTVDSGGSGCEPRKVPPSKLELDSSPLSADVSPPDQPLVATARVEELRKERLQVMARLAGLKAKLSEIELQEDEQIRETEMETALVSGEISSLKSRIADDEARESRLQAGIRECDVEMEKCLAEQEQSRKHFGAVSENSKTIILTLEKQIETCDNPDFKEELSESLSQQIELLDAEKKAHEDLEFRLMEEEAGWLSRREELQRELSELSAKIKQRRDKLTSLINNNESYRINQQLEKSKIFYLKAIEKDRGRLKEVNSDLEKLTSCTFPDTEDSNASTTTDDETKEKSFDDDMHRISRITSTTPIDVSSNSLGRKTIASLQEIERNRHLHIIKQGSQVIQEERARVEELKRKVQDEVRAQWELQRNSRSLTSLTDEPARDSGLGSEEADKRASPDDEDKKHLDLENSNVENDLDSRCTGATDSRPLSDASTCSNELPDGVRLRNKSHNPNLQRPLTRYLPIKSDDLDLRQHIIEAGHQIDLCPSVILNSSSCRGFLHKLGSRWPKWNKRWFVFDRTKRCLAYYSDKSEKKLRGGAYFQAIEEVYVDHLNSVKSPTPKVTFIVKSLNRTFHLVAPSPEAMRIWVDVIFTGAEGYQQYMGQHH